jgi:hypothetical protein
VLKEEFGRCCHCFGFPNLQVSIRVKRVVKEMQQSFLQWVLKINHKVATAYEIDSREGRITKNIVRCKNTKVAYFFDDPIAAINFGKERTESFFGNADNVGFGV